MLVIPAIDILGGHCVRLTQGDYDNPTGELRVKGAMAHMVGLFVPDDMSKWPKIDLNDPTYQRDLASLQVRGEDVGMQH